MYNISLTKEEVEYLDIHLGSIEAEGISDDIFLKVYNARHRKPGDSPIMIGFVVICFILIFAINFYGLYRLLFT